MKFSHTFRAFNSRNYRLFFSGQSISLLGNWMTMTASGWLVYHLSSNAFYVGAVGFFTQIPLLVFAPFTGVIVDRIDRHRAFILLQIVAMLQSATLAVFTLSGHLNVPILLGLCLWQGLINAWEFPVRQSLIISFVDRREDLPSAIAMGSSMFNLARLIGPVLAGFVIANWGAGVCYAIDSATYLPVLAMLFAMRRPPFKPRPNRTAPLADLREGLAYIRSRPVLRTVLTMIPVVALAGWAHSVLAPVFASALFGGDARLLGFMLACIGGGAICGALLLGSRATAEGLRSVVTRGLICLTIGQGIFAYSPWLPLSFVGLALCGFGGVSTMSGSNTWVQSVVDDDKRGRVMGLFSMGQGVFPIGSLIIGAIAEYAGARAAVGLATLVVAGATLVWIRQRQRV